MGPSAKLPPSPIFCFTPMFRGSPNGLPRFRSHPARSEVHRTGYSWAAAVADFNHDGILDVASGPYYYLGPDYTKRKEIWAAATWNPGTEYAFDSWMEFAGDFTEIGRASCRERV